MAIKKTPEEILDELEKKYGDSRDDRMMIEATRNDLPYLRKREAQPGFSGQTALQAVLELKDVLEWD